MHRRSVLALIGLGIASACAEDGAPLTLGNGDGGRTDLARDAGRDDAGGSDTGGDDTGVRDTRSDAGVPGIGERLELEIEDVCECGQPGLCCPDFTVRIRPSRRCLCLIACGDAVACEPPPIIWERRTDDGEWTAEASPSENGAGPRCSDDEIATTSLAGLGSFEPFPQEPGTYRVRAVLAEYAIGPADGCLPERTGTVEAVSNPITVPF